MSVFARDPAMSQDSSGQRHDRTALIIYGSESGNAQDGAEQLGRITQRLRFATTVVAMDSIEINILTKFTVVMFVIATAGQGDMPANARRVWKSLLRKRLRADCLNNMSFTTFGFGDSSYVKFNWAARKLHKRLEQLGAQEIYPRGEADEQHDEGTDGAFLPWTIDLKLHLLKQFPLSDGVSPIPDSELLPPRWTVTLVDTLSNSPTHTTTSTTQQVTGADLFSDTLSVSPRQGVLAKMDGPITTNIPRLTESVLGDDNVEELLRPPTDLLPIPGCLTVTCESNRRITQKGHWQDVRAIDLYLEGDKTYAPGDTVTIYPKNFPEDVDSLIKLQGWEYVADRPIQIESTAQALGQESFIPRVANMPTVRTPTLRSLLLNNLDICSIPRRYFFEIIAKFTDDPVHRERLQDFCNPAFSDEFFDYSSRPRRSILEVLYDFPSVRIPWFWAPSVFPEIRGRQYSISSGGLLMSPGPEVTMISICVALVKYQTVLKKIRQGVCSRYLASLHPGTEINITLSRSETFCITKDKLEKPIIMVAPGTGVAPMRSLIWQRLWHAEEDNLNTAKAILIYGGRNKEADFLFGDEWARPGFDIEVLTAFSRDQREKIYVQDVIRQKFVLMYEMLVKSKGSVYVCGSSGKMPVSVRAAFINAFKKARVREGEYDTTDEEAEADIVLMEKEGRYTQETW